MKWPTLEQLRSASAAGNRKYLADQEEQLASCFKSWRAGVLEALRSVVKDNALTYRVSVGPGGGYSDRVLRMAHDLLEMEVRNEIPGIDIQHYTGHGFFVVTWDRTDFIFG